MKQPVARHRTYNRRDGYAPVDYLGAGDPPVGAWAKPVTRLKIVTTAFEGDVLARPGDWLVRDDLPDRSLSVWSRGEFERAFEFVDEEAVA